MLIKHKKRPVKRIFLALSLVAIAIWAMLGTGASLAWFNDASPEVKNIFNFADFDVKVSHRLADGTWQEIDSQTEIFNKNALYEPGYSQVVYLKVENKGEREFEFQTSVNITKPGEYDLQDYLKFGLVTAKDEQELNDSLLERSQATRFAKVSLGNYSTDTAILNVGETSYMALIVCMPESVNNIANRYDQVELGLSVKADQIKK